MASPRTQNPVQYWQLRKRPTVEQAAKLIEISRRNWGVGGHLGVTNPFVVYDGNTADLGLFGQSDANIIVKAYTLAKAHAESITSVERKLERYVDEFKMYRGADDLMAGMRSGAQLRSYMDRMGSMLKKESVEVLAAGDEAIKVLKKHEK